MTEDQAKTKTCPWNILMMSNIQIALVGNDKAIDDAKSLGYCQASDCMMWKWDESTNKEILEANPKGDCLYEGYCGLTK